MKKLSLIPVVLFSVAICAQEQEVFKKIGTDWESWESGHKRLGVLLDASKDPGKSKSLNDQLSLTAKLARENDIKSAALESALFKDYSLWAEKQIEESRKTIQKNLGYDFEIKRPSVLNPFERAAVDYFLLEDLRGLVGSSESVKAVASNQKPKKLVYFPNGNLVQRVRDQSLDVFGESTAVEKNSDHFEVTTKGSYSPVLDMDLKIDPNSEADTKKIQMLDAILRNSRVTVSFEKAENGTLNAVVELLENIKVSGVQDEVKVFTAGDKLKFESIASSDILEDYLVQDKLMKDGFKGHLQRWTFDSSQKIPKISLGYPSLAVAKSKDFSENGSSSILIYEGFQRADLRLRIDQVEPALLKGVDTAVIGDFSQLKAMIEAPLAEKKKAEEAKNAEEQKKNEQQKLDQKQKDFLKKLGRINVPETCPYL